MSLLIKLPMAGANDEFAEITAWLKKKGEFVNKGDLICAAETTKAVMDIEAESSGYLVPLVGEGQQVAIGQPIAALTDHLDEDIGGLLSASTGEGPISPAIADRRWTRKAEMLAARYGINLSSLLELHPDKTIGEADVMAFLQSVKSTTSEITQPQTPTYEADQVERILILGGARGGGATLVLDALARIPSQRAIGIVDQDPSLNGEVILGVPVLGPTSMTEELWDSGRFDGAVIAFNSDLNERAELFERLSGRNIRFSNVIDVTSVSRLNVRVGTGNIILALCYLGPFASIGDNNFLSSHTRIEHHCRLGSHCAFGPSVTFSGRVTVGNRVRFASNIAVEPDVQIGNDVIIASGSILTRSIPDNSVVKARIDYAIRPRDGRGKG